MKPVKTKTRRQIIEEFIRTLPRFCIEDLGVYRIVDVEKALERIND